MPKIRIVTDSTADIPVEIRERLGIEMVPLKVHFGSETYLDGVTLQPEEFYRKLSEASQLPTTSQPSPLDFQQVYKKLADEGSIILSLHLSSHFSGTYQSAALASSLLEEKADITIIDTRSATYGIGLLAVAAAEAAQEGRSKEEILALIERLRSQTSLYFLVDTLEYLHKGGRIGRAAAVFGSLLNVKPILSIDEEGVVTSVDKVRGSKRAMNRIIELLKADFSGQVDLTVAHACSPVEAEEFYRQLQDHLDIRNVQFTTIGPVIGTHVGDGTLGVFAVPV